MAIKYTEDETEQYYDGEDTVYRELWDSEGSVHWGLFDESTGLDFLKACTNLNEFMWTRGGIDESSRVLDIGCGSGTTAMSVSEELGCNITGVDLSGVRVENAIEDLQSRENVLKNRVQFKKGSATDLPFDDESFTHIWSQATFYHVPDKTKVLEEAYRVLEHGGTIVFDDLLKPRADVSELGQKFVYERLLYDTDFSFISYQEALQAAGFKIVEAYDLSPHLKTSYEHLAKVASKGSKEHTERFEYLARAYTETALSVDRGDVGWGLFICHK